MTCFLYVAAFDTGLIKVGRSERPHHRIAQHEDRLTVAGVTLVAKHVVECVGGPVTAESALIERCVAAATERRKGEWFMGLRYSDVCSWANEAANGDSQDCARDLNTGVDKAAKALGGLAPLARAIGVTPPAITEWRSGRRPVPIERCTQIEQVTEGVVRRWHLRPDDWHRIWPELIAAEGAPAVPTETTEAA